jgi:hemerythrin
MPIYWRDKMSVGNDVIDQDHKYLICLMNSVELALKHDDTLDSLPVFIKQLEDYTREHFKREESIQTKALYPLLNEHRREHADILRRLEEVKPFVADYLSKKREGTLEFDEEVELNGKITDLARRWILEHLLNADKKMDYYLRKLPRSFR